MRAPLRTVIPPPPPWRVPLWLSPGQRVTLVLPREGASSSAGGGFTSRRLAEQQRVAATVAKVIGITNVEAIRFTLEGGTLQTVAFADLAASQIARAGDKPEEGSSAVLSPSDHTAHPNQVWSQRHRLWIASVRRHGAPKRIGKFDTPLEAALAQDAYVRAHRLEDENTLNFPDQAAGGRDGGGDLEDESGKGSETDGAGRQRRSSSSSSAAVGSRGRTGSPEQKQKQPKKHTRSSAGGQRMGGRKIGKRTASRYKGVSWVKAQKKWKVTLMIGGETLHLGRFAGELDAARAYDAYVMKKKLPRHLNRPDDSRAAQKYKPPPFTSRFRGVCWSKHCSKWEVGLHSTADLSLAYLSSSPPHIRSPGTGSTLSSSSHGTHPPPYLVLLSTVMPSSLPLVQPRLPPPPPLVGHAGSARCRGEEDEPWSLHNGAWCGARV